MEEVPSEHTTFDFSVTVRTTDLCAGPEGCGLNKRKDLTKAAVARDGAHVIRHNFLHICTVKITNTPSNESSESFLNWYIYCHYRIRYVCFELRSHSLQWLICSSETPLFQAGMWIHSRPVCCGLLNYLLGGISSTTLIQTPVSSSCSAFFVNAVYSLLVNEAA